MEEVSFTCPRCGNKDPRFIGMRNGKPYCRRCVSFIGSEAEQFSYHSIEEVHPSLHYGLSEDQKRLSKDIIDNFKKGIDTLVYAVCGAGKTELSYGVISYALSKGMSVGFALPRRDVVIELFWRLKEAFPKKKVVAVYGEHTFDLKGDIIILTTHQLYRYTDYFDLLVMDEIDAFPFKGNDVLIAMYKASVRGHSVMMSATPSKEIIAEFHKPMHAIVELRTRFHKKPIPVPKSVCLPSFFWLPFTIKKLREYRTKGKPSLVFVPSVSKSEELYDELKFFAKNGDYVNSQREERPEVIEKFKKGGYEYLVTTSVLERGVTIKGLQVLVYGADEERIYSANTLIQIAGRVGRKMDEPGGEVIFLSSKRTASIEEAIGEIKRCNTFL